MTTIGTKTRPRFGCWNIRTMLETSRLAQVAHEFNNYKLNFLGLSETRWNGSGQYNLRTGELLLYSGKQPDESHESGVGILLSKSIKKSLISWSPISDRLITATLQSKLRKITIVQCYAPTEVADRIQKDDFYEALNTTLSQIRKSNIVILLGDLNAKVGADNTNLENVMGVHGLGTMNENGELFTDTCNSHNLVIGGTLFPHKTIHKETWISPNHAVKNQIDHIAISQKWRSSLLDTRSVRGADVASDHHLVVGQLRLKLAKCKNTNNNFKRLKLNTEKLKNPKVRNELEKRLREKLTRENNENISNWSDIQTTLRSTSEEVLGVKTTKRKEWITSATWNKIAKRKDIKNKINNARNSTELHELKEKYKNENRDVKHSARNDKRTWANELAQAAQAAADLNNARELYRISKKLAKKNFRNETATVRDKNGAALTTDEEQLTRWTEHFSELLSAPQLPFNDHSEIDIPTVNINITPPSIPDIVAAISKLKNGKAAGPDNIPPEIFKACPLTIANILKPCIQEAWNQEKIPDDWKNGLIIKLPKKGDLSNCQNWRGITLLNCINKILASIILDRLSNKIDAKLRNEQAGFRRHRSCTDQINTLRIIVEQSNEFQSPLHLVFVDFERAFDTLSHAAIWTLLHDAGIPAKIINLIKALYQNSKCHVIHKSKISKDIEVLNGVKQGCLLSPMLFNLALDSIMRTATSTPAGIRWSFTKRLEDLDYADDICLMSHSFNDMNQKLHRLDSEARKVGLKINIRKTKHLKINTSNDGILSLNGEQIENVQEFTYLGSTIDVDGGTNKDVLSRIQKAKRAFGLLNNIWASRAYSLKTKIRIFNTNVKSVLLYSCETWKVTKNLTSQLQVFVNKCLRKILRIFWPDKISNTELWTRSNQEPIQSQICKRKWGWLGHTLRKPFDDISREALDWNPQGARKRGRPKNTWKRTIIEEAKRLGKSWGELKAIANNRIRWSKLIEALCSAME